MDIDSCELVSAELQSYLVAVGLLNAVINRLIVIIMIRFDCLSDQFQNFLNNGDYLPKNLRKLRTC